MDLHGGNTYKLKREGRGEVLDYSSNINPLGVPKKFKQKAIENFDLLERYTDPDYVELRESIGKFNNMEIENIVVGNGATEVLFLYVKALKPRKAMVVAPAFAEYRKALEAIDCEIVYYPLLPNKKFLMDTDEFLKSIPDCDLVIICNPNNPTGSFIPLKEIAKVNRNLKERGIKLFIDEAFIEFMKDWREFSAVNLKDENIFVMRSMTKFFAIPGLRLGYGLTCNQEIIEKMKNYKEPWTVNTFADMAGKIILTDNEYIEATEKWIEEEKIWFYDKALKIAGLTPYRTNTNFMLMRVENKTASEVKEKMIERGILIRDASNFVGLDNHYIRIAIKTRDENKKVLNTLAEILK
ncbi:threonine-phosphate decarboxylase CobD [Fusobacterium necrogenes]|uniref:threonine-phosphate decarboxylase CobD n=1 Tax=Fusobacterium necrogenes TaxID=858 RepID=UPI00255CECB6|nr:threonine-phosphate decarboxylase CobD [Fusobacterium necrogenes]